MKRAPLGPLEDAERDVQAEFPPVGPVNPSFHVLAGLLVLMLSLGALFAWSVAAPLSSAVVALGTVVVDSSRKILQHPEGGVIRQIHVRDGDVVDEGQILVSLHNEELLAADARSSQLLLMAEAKRARLRAEREGAAEIEFPSSVLDASLEDAARIVADQESIFRARRAALDSRTTALESKRAQAEDSVVGLEQQLFQQKERVRLTESEIDDTRVLAEKGFAPRRRLLELERALAQLQGRTAELEIALKDAQRSASFHELEIEQTRAAYQETVESELQMVQKEIYSLRENRRSITHRLADLEMRAPTAGTVVNLAVHTIGGVVGPGSVLMEIVPLDDPLVVDARISPSDVDYVASDMPADVYLPGAQRRTSPPIRGRVVNVSADLIAQAQLGEPHYLARVELPDEVGEVRRFRPGLPVEVIVVRGERTLMSFLLDPLSRTFAYAFKD